MPFSRSGACLAAFGEVQRCCSLASSYSSEGSVITALILHRGPQAQYQLVEEQHGLQNTSTNHPSVAIVYQNHMWLWCLFIIMRMKISSIWLLPRKLRNVKYCMCPGTCRSFCSQIQKLQPALNRQYSDTRNYEFWMPGIHYCCLCSVVYLAYWHRKNKKSLSTIWFCSRSD